MRTSIQRFAMATMALGVASSAGCIHIWSEFDDLAKGASVWQVGVANPGPDFGDVLLGYEAPTSVSPTRGTRLFVGGGANPSSVSTFAAFGITDEARAPGEPVASNASLRAVFRDTLVRSPVLSGCSDTDRDGALLRCGIGRRAVAAVPVVHTTSGDLLGCVLVTTGSTVRRVAGVDSVLEGFQVQCELGAAGNSTNLVLAPGLGWGASAVGVPLVHDVGVAVLGAPLTRGNEGALFLLPHVRDYGPEAPGAAIASGELRNELVVSGLSLEAGDRLGDAVAATAIGSTPTTPFRLAATFGSGSNRRVAIVDVTWSATNGASAQVVGCLRGEGASFGSQLAFGDFDGDNVADLVVGAVDRAIAEGESLVSVFNGSDFAATTCGAGAPAVAPTRSIGCLPQLAPNIAVDCTNSQFGYALATGDLNADGKDDIVVGAPRADTDGHVDGGLVQTIPGGAFATLGEGPRGSLTVNNSTIGSSLGVAVTTIPSIVTTVGERRVVRADIAASRATGQGTFIFLCSGITDDSPNSLNAPMDARVEFGCGLIQDHAQSMTSPTIALEASSNLAPLLTPVER